MAKKKQGSGKIAIPFLITTLVSLILIGIPALYYYNKITLRGEEINGTNKSQEYAPSVSDSGNILVVLDFNDESLVKTFFVLRAEPMTRKFILVPFLNSTSLTTDNKTATINDFYSSGGIVSVKSALENTFDIKINKYIKLEDESFCKLCDIFGGASYNVPAGLKGFNAGEQYLSSEQIQNLITHYAFADEEQRVYYASGVITAMINQTTGERIAGNLETNFNSVMNLVGESDIAALDFTAKQKVIEYIFEEDKYDAQFKNPSGNWEDNMYVLSQDDIAEVKEWLADVSAEETEE